MSSEGLVQTSFGHFETAQTVTRPQEHDLAMTAADEVTSCGATNRQVVDVHKRQINIYMRLSM